MVTVEMAAALPVLMVLVLTGLYAVRVVDARTQCLDAAREVARAAARGDVRAVADGRSVLPSADRITVVRSGGTVTATVTVRVLSAGSLPSVAVTERAVAAIEPSEPVASPAGGAARSVDISTRGSP